MSSAMNVRVSSKLSKLKLPLAVAAIVVGFALTGCGSSRSHTAHKSVEIPQTVIKSQDAIGFCWSYATMGFFETMLLKKTGQSFDLSEEALGFYRMAEELHRLSRKYEASELATAEAVEEKTFEHLEGWDLTFNPIYNPGFNTRNSLQLAQDYGVVPEQVWSYKFATRDQVDQFFSTVFTGFAGMMQAHGRGHLTSEMIFDLLASPGAYGSRPPSEFAYVQPNGENRRVTSQAFLADVIGFTPDEFTYMITDEQIDYSKLVRAMKLTLARGINVPLSYNIYKGSSNSWDASISAKPLDLNNLVQVGGHAVLITDFVNYNGRPGFMTSQELNHELARPSEDLDFVVIKNSWDTTGQSPKLRLPGYYTMDQSYIQLLAKKPADIAIVVPRDIAFQVRYNQ